MTGRLGLKLAPMMNVVLLLLALQYLAVVTGQFTAPPPTCSGDTFTFSCTVTGDRNGITIWRVNGSKECSLLHTKTSAPVPCWTDSPFTVATGTGFGTSTASFSSTLSGTATPALNGTLVKCFGPDLNRTAENMVGNSTLQILGPPSVPTLSCVDLSQDISGAVNVTVSWTLSGGDSADFYLISITTNAPQTPYGGLLNFTNASVTQYELTGFMAGYEYSITVRGVNCGSEEGSKSEPLIVTPQVPAVPSSCNITLSYNQSSGRLLSINSTWNTVPDPVDPGEACPGPSGDITQYQIRFQSDSVSTTQNVDIARCTAGRCSHTFEPLSNPPSSYDSVSVAAENVVGVGAARTCTTQTISTINSILTGKVVNIGSPTDAQLQCIFLSGYNGSSHCTVQYWTDPTYMNLPYSAESTEIGAARNSVSMVLREQMNSSTVYYYTMSSVSGDVTVLMRGTFTTPEYCCSVMDLWNLPAADATILTDVSLLNNSAAQYPTCDAGSVGSVALVNTTLDTVTVAFYSGTIAGSTACFVCDESSGYKLNTTTTAERVCRSNGMWSGSPITCGMGCDDFEIKWWQIVLLVIGGLVVVLVITGIFVYCRRKEDKDTKDNQGSEDEAALNTQNKMRSQRKKSKGKEERYILQFPLNPIYTEQKEEAKPETSQRSEQEKESVGLTHPEARSSKTSSHSNGT